MTTTVVYPGTFDPITLGHEDVLRRACTLFDRVVVGVAAAHHKKTMFTLAQRMDMVTEVLADVHNLEVKVFDGLVVDFCAANDAAGVVRGVRNHTDFDFEAQMAAMNNLLSPSFDTIVLLPRPSLQCISSTLVREISNLGGDVSALVSPPVGLALAQAKRMREQMAAQLSVQTLAS